MRSKWLGVLLTAGACAATLSLTGQANASQSFGSLPGGTTFGGTGIATNAAEISTAPGQGSDTITLGLEGTPYGPGPGTALNNNGKGTYYAPAGASPANSARGTWNFDYYIGISTGDFSDYKYSLTIGNGSTVENLGDPTTFGGTADINNADQNSENVDFYFPPNLPGDYTVDLEVLNQAGAVLDTDQITVDVGSVPDTASTLMLTAATVGGLLFVSRKKLAGLSI